MGNEDGNPVINAADEIEITPEMIEAGAEVIRSEIGGVEGLTGFFSVSSLAESVYRAMWQQKNGC